MFRPQRLTKYDPRIVQSWRSPGVFVSIKIDGWRLTWFPQEQVFRTRSGKLYQDTTGFLAEQANNISPEYMLDGELLDGKFYVFDAPDLPGTFHQRYDWLYQTFTWAESYYGEQEYVNLVPQDYYDMATATDEFLQSRLREAVADKQEGLVIRASDMEYTQDVSREALKLKPNDTTEVLVVAYYTTPDAKQNQAEGYVSSLICYTEDERDFRLSIKRQQKYCPKLGDIVEVQHSGTENDLPKFQYFSRSVLTIVLTVIS